MSAVFDHIEREYLSGHWRQTTPAKLSLAMARHRNDLPSVFTNLMVAELSDGQVGAKVVSVNELTGQMDGRAMLFDCNGQLLRSVPAGLVTRMRCAYMAVLAIKRFYRNLPPQLIPELRVGFIGTGAINRQTAIELERLLGIAPYMAKGSPRNPQKNRYQTPWDKTCFVTDPVNLVQCDVLVSCTNAHEPSEQLQVGDLLKNASTTDGLPRLIIAQDTGWLFGQSFRGCFDNYADDPLQLRAHLTDEFPYDDAAPDFSVADWLGDDQFDCFNYERSGAAVYLYGTAIADAAFLQAGNTSRFA